MIVRNFLFHRVSNEVDALWPPMKPEFFQRIIQYLTTKFKLINLEDLLTDNIENEKVTKPLATVLFDDGYKDNIEYAAPILKKYNCPASFYIVTDCIDRNIPTWTYILDYSVQNTLKPSVELTFDYVPEAIKKVELGKVLHPSVKKLKPWMKTLPNSQRIQIMQAICDQTNDVSIPRHEMMSWRDIKELAGDGFIIGSHSNTHPMLSQLEDHDKIEAELRTSYVKITDQIGHSPTTISYPIGAFDKRVMNLSEKVGYKFGLAVGQRFYNTKTDSLFAIPRIELYQQPWYKTQARINGIYTILKRIWK